MQGREIEYDVCKNMPRQGSGCNMYDVDYGYRRCDFWLQPNADEVKIGGYFGV